MAIATRTILIDVTPEQFFAVITDYAKYAEFLPAVKSTQVAAGGGLVREVIYTISLQSRLVTYTLRHTASPPFKMTWTLIKGEALLKGNDGSWILRPSPGGGTEATYALDLQISALMPAFIEKAIAEQSLPVLLSSFKARAEQLHARTTG